MIMLATLAAALLSVSQPATACDKGSYAEVAKGMLPGVTDELLGPKASAAAVARIDSIPPHDEDPSPAMTDVHVWRKPNTPGAFIVLVDRASGCIDMAAYTPPAIIEWLLGRAPRPEGLAADPANTI